MATETISVATGAEFFVRLGTAPSAGYGWNLREHADAIELLDSHFEKNPAAGSPGDSGIQVFRMRARRSGSFVMTFELKRSWESEPVESCTMRLTVN